MQKIKNDFGKIRGGLPIFIQISCICTSPYDVDRIVGSACDLLDLFHRLSVTVSQASLMGIERREADCSMKSMQANFTNEGGYGHRFRYLKNIMGLWMIQSVKKEFESSLQSTMDVIFSFAARAQISAKDNSSSNSFFTDWIIHSQEYE